ncbi:unnamed protein product, partial [Chrysoparadoxa australica]
ENRGIIANAKLLLRLLAHGGLPTPWALPWALPWAGRLCTPLLTLRAPPLTASRSPLSLLKMEPEEIPAVSEEGKQKPDCTLPAAGEEMSSAGDANVSGEGQSGAKVEDANEEQAAAPEKPLSKNQLKKLKKQAQRNELKRQKKLAKAEQRKKREEELLAKGITPEWLKKSRPRPEGELTMGQRLKAKEHSEFRKRLQASGYRIVIDLGFDDKMTEKEIGSLVKQVTYVHNSNKNAAKPCTVHLTGMGPVMTEAMNKKSTGHANWIEFTMSTKEFTECFPKEDLVYLTADSPDELSELTNDKVYIIGGIVDRNRHKMITQEKAEKLGVATARLPKLNELRMESSHVLAVNHVYDILLRVCYLTQTTKETTKQ